MAAAAPAVSGASGGQIQPAYRIPHSTRAVGRLAAHGERAVPGAEVPTSWPNSAPLTDGPFSLEVRRLPFGRLECRRGFEGLRRTPAEIIKVRVSLACFEPARHGQDNRKDDPMG